MISRKTSIWIWAVTLLVTVSAGVYWAPSLRRYVKTETPSGEVLRHKSVSTPDPNTRGESDLVTSVPRSGEPPADPVFAKWLEREGEEVNRPKIDPVKKSADMRKALAELNTKKQRQLLQTLLDTAASAGSRILSIYLLSEAGPQTNGEIAAFLQAPIPSFGESAPHSVAETRNQQERAMRLMAIDAMAARALKEPSSLSAFEKTVSTIADPSVRAYAQRKLKEVRGSSR
jgi:hypothetical protein